MTPLRLHPPCNELPKDGSHNSRSWAGLAPTAAQIRTFESLGGSNLFHRWNRKPQPHEFSKLVFIMLHVVIVCPHVPMKLTMGNCGTSIRAPQIVKLILQSPF